MEEVYLLTALRIYDSSLFILKLVPLFSFDSSNLINSVLLILFTYFIVGDEWSTGGFPKALNWIDCKVYLAAMLRTNYHLHRW